MTSEDRISLKGHGEDKLIQDLLAQLPLNVRQGFPHQTTQIKIIAGAEKADDCAVLESINTPSKYYQLLKTDCVIEGIHFASDTPAELVGRKALARVISDFAAMGGGVPQSALVTVALPENTPITWAKNLSKGLGAIAEEFQIVIVGGETSRSLNSVFISISLEGLIEKERCVFRSGGKNEDVLFVTGKLGNSLNSKRHLSFKPRVKEANWLTEHFSIHAMMDLSDGVAKDLPRLARASGIGFQIDQTKIPLAQGCESWEDAVNDGEDYELLFSLNVKDAAKLVKQWEIAWPGVALTEIGKLTNQVSITDAQKIFQGKSGYDHFYGQ